MSFLDFLLDCLGTALEAMIGLGLMGLGIAFAYSMAVLLANMIH